MEDRGWTPIEESDGSFSFSVTEEQRTAFQVDNEECISLAGANLEPDKSRDEWKVLHDSLLDTHDCLVEYGLDLPDAPTFQSWMDSGRAWGPYGDIPIEEIETRLAEFEDACPQPIIY